MAIFQWSNIWFKITMLIFITRIETGGRLCITHALADIPKSCAFWWSAVLALMYEVRWVTPLWVSIIYAYLKSIITFSESNVDWNS
jgi:hypothetical protein